MKGGTSRHLNSCGWTTLPLKSKNMNLWRTTKRSKVYFLYGEEYWDPPGSEIQNVSQPVMDFMDLSTLRILTMSWFQAWQIGRGRHAEISIFLLFLCNIFFRENNSKPSKFMKLKWKPIRRSLRKTTKFYFSIWEPMTAKNWESSTDLFH